tara:strand:+ start:521 stop:958 length:438 start_codon:yes stop_codon:yes gene_type:complete
MKKINRILVFLGILIIGCQEKEILPCTTFSQDNGITYTNQKIYSGTCHLIQDDIIWKTVTFKRGKLSKEVTYHIPEGSIAYIGNRNKDGQIDGDFIRYFKNGNIELEGQLEKGYYDGDWKYYNEEGELIKEITWDMGIEVDSIIY